MNQLMSKDSLFYETTKSWMRIIICGDKIMKNLIANIINKYILLFIICIYSKNCDKALCLREVTTEIY